MPTGAWQDERLVGIRSPFWRPPLETSLFQGLEAENRFFLSFSRRVVLALLFVQRGKYRGGFPHFCGSRMSLGSQGYKPLKAFQRAGYNILVKGAVAG